MIALQVLQGIVRREETRSKDFSMIKQREEKIEQGAVCLHFTFRYR